MSYRDDSLIYGRENIFRDYDGITPKIDANGSPVISGWHTENNSNGYVSDWIMRIVYDSTFDEPVIEIYACDSGQLVCCHPITTFIL